MKWPQAFFKYLRMTQFFVKIRDYFVDAYHEMKKVVWPTRKQTINYSLTVILLTIGLAVFFAALDYVLSLGLDKLIQ